MRTLTLALLITLLNYVLPLHSASFDCTKASAETQIAICEDPELIALDILMHNAFSASLKNSIKSIELKNKQKDWINERNLCLSNINCIKRNYRSQLSQTWSENCSEKFVVPFKLLENAYSNYGTAYSGGDHSRFLGDISSTLDLYRGLNGLKSLEFQKTARPFDLHFREPRKELISAINQKYISSNLINPLHAQKYDLGVIYDIGLKVIDNKLDWWINPATHASSYSKTISNLSLTNESLDWILSIMSASHLPWNISWNLKFTSEQRFIDARKNLLQHAIKNFKISDNLQWIAVAAMFTVSSDPEVELIKDYFNKLIQPTINCIHTTEEILTLNMLAFELSRILGLEFFLNHNFLMTDVLKHYASQNLYRQELSLFLESTKSNTTATHHLQNLKSLSDINLHPIVLRKIGVAIGYLSPNISDLIANINYITDRHPSLSEHYYKGNSNDFQFVDAKLMRALNVLSIDDLIEVSAKLRLNKSDTKILLNVSLNRSFVLGQYKKSQKLLTSLLDYLSDEKKQKVLYASSLKLPEEVLLAVSILNIEEKTTWIINKNFQPDRLIGSDLFYKSGTDLNEEFLNTSFLERDLNTILMHPSYWWGLCAPYFGHCISQLSRHHDRVTSIGFEFEKGSGYTFDKNMQTSIFNLTDKTKLQNFSPKNGLAQKLSQIILRWEKDEGTRWYRQSLYHDEIANNLGKIIRLQKRNRMEKIDGKYLGQIAFKKLKKHYSDTKTSQNTKYWFHCNQNCR